MFFWHKHRTTYRNIRRDTPNRWCCRRPFVSKHHYLGTDISYSRMPIRTMRCRSSPSRTDHTFHQQCCVDKYSVQFPNRKFPHVCYSCKAHTVGMVLWLGCDGIQARMTHKIDPNNHPGRYTVRSMLPVVQPLHDAPSATQRHPIRHGPASST